MTVGMRSSTGVRTHNCCEARTASSELASLGNFFTLSSACSWLTSASLSNDAYRNSKIPGHLGSNCGAGTEVAILSSSSTLSCCASTPASDDISATSTSASRCIPSGVFTASLRAHKHPSDASKLLLHAAEHTNVLQIEHKWPHDLRLHFTVHMSHTVSLAI